MAIEFEIKFRATPQSLELLRDAVEGTQAQFAMQTTYYDTPSGALSARHYTLRQRRENESWICTLKYPAKVLGRGEIEVENPSLETALPELCKLSGLTDLPLLLAEGLVPVCGAKFHRVTKTFTWENTTMELALDTGVLTGGGKEEPLCEAELELKQGDPETVKRYALALAAKYRLQPERRSKFRRALALAKGE